MEVIEYKISDRIAHITLNRPQKRNALNKEMVSLLTQRIIEANNHPEVKLVVLGARGKVFSAGADLKYLKSLQKNTYEENIADSGSLRDLFQLIYTLDKVVIAKVQGHAIAGGCGLASVCDLVISQPDAMFGYTEVRIGFVPAIVMVYLLRRLGEGSARELLLSGHLIDALTAKKIGLVNRVVPSESLDGAVATLAKRIIEDNSEQSMKRVKTMISKIQDLDFEAALNYAVKQNADARNSEDCKKGIQAFIEKKPIKW
ncbi:MAG: enoyl-CoA hydratase [Cyclobacteriaceae bacterium]|nr:MAG: enoyl-CoA hydratase [Cyclobacteriaceae bacterium]